MSNDDFSQIEQELKALRLRRPSPGLRDRISRELQAQQSPVTVLTFPRFLRRIAPLAAAAAITFVVVSHLAPDGARAAKDSTSNQLLVAGAKPEAGALTNEALSSPAPTWTPVEAKRVLVGRGEPDYAQLPDGTPVQLVRQLSVETFTWKDSRGKASLTWSLPLEEVRVIPSSSF